MIARLRKRSEPAAIPALASEPTPSARDALMVSGELEDAREALSARGTAVDAARAAYDAALDDGREAALAARERLAEAEVDRDIAGRAVARLEGELAAVQEAERAAELARTVAAADAAVDAYRAAVEALLPEMGRAAHEIARAWAEAEIANSAAEEALQADAKRRGEQPSGRLRQGVEAFRATPGRPREPIGKPVEQHLWTNSAGIALADELQALIQEQPDGSGQLSRNGVRTSFEHKRMFRTQTYLPAEMAQVPDRLVENLLVPALKGGELAGWKAPIPCSPRGVLALLDKLDQPAAQGEDRRRPVTETIPVGPVRQVHVPPPPFRTFGS